MDPKQAAKYFKPLSLKLPLILLAIGILTLMAGFAGSVEMVVVGLIFAGLGGFLLYNQTQGRPTDADIDQAIQAVAGGAREQGLARLGLDESEVNLIQPVVIPGPDLRNSRGMVKKGKDGVLRAAANEVLVLYFSENEVHSYTHQFNVTDPTVRRESTDEYFYRDIVSVSTVSDPERVTLPTGESLEVNWDRFRLTTSGGTSISVAAYNAGELSQSIQGMRALIKQRKLL